MAGLETRLRPSIRRRLSWWLSASILGMAVVAGTFSFSGAYNEAHEAQDDMLRQVAVLLRHQPSALLDMAGAHVEDPQVRLIVQLLPETTAQRQPSTALPLSNSLPDGLQTLSLPSGAYRVLVAKTLTGRRIAIAQETTARDELAMDSATRTVLPLLVLMPVLLLLVAYIVRTLLQPIARLSAEVEARGDGELHALPEHGLPVEIRPFVVAINRLLVRVSDVLEAHQRFVADAAHELRSPMTAISLQAERLEGSDLGAPTRERLRALRQGIERSRALLEQLLAYASLQRAETTAPARSAVGLVLRRTLEAMLPLAEVKDLDIGMQVEADAVVAISETDLGIVLKNLIENAIRYTPAKGRIDMGVQRSGPCAHVVVEDSGPGINPAERAFVLRPFYRTLGSHQIGSGLGLAIVKSVLDRNHAEMHFAYADELMQHGLRVTVSIPLAPEAAHRV